jgi:hypothetical protein
LTSNISNINALVFYKSVRQYVAKIWSKFQLDNMLLRYEVNA